MVVGGYAFGTLLGPGTTGLLLFVGCPLVCGVAAGGGGRVVAGFPHMTVIMICLHTL